MPCEAAQGNGGSGLGGDRLQRHRSLHSPSKAQSKNARRSLENNNRHHHHRRATSVRVRPTYLLEAATGGRSQGNTAEAAFEDDLNLPEPPVSINVASPEDEEEDPANTLGHR